MTEQKFSRRVRQIFWGRLPFAGLAGALIFFCLSMTPTLLPRIPFLQGAVAGLTAVIGFGLGSAASALTRKVVSEPDATSKRKSWLALTILAVLLIPLFLVLGDFWQDEVRELMGMPEEPFWSMGLILLVTLFIFYLVLVISRLVRALGRSLIGLAEKVIPRSVALTFGVIAAGVITIWLFQGFVLNPLADAINSAFSLANDGTTEGIEPTTDPLRSGSPESLISWESLGVKGRDFVGLGPTVADIEQFTGNPAVAPIRAYAGIKSADSIEDQVALLMRELDRTDAWERDVIAVFTATGSGWVNHRAVDPLEYMHGGNTAAVALQYSFLPSWISFLVDDAEAAAAGKTMITAVSERLATMDPNTRPKLLVFGESLGSFGTEAAFEDIDDMLNTVDGALLSGPVFRNAIRDDLTARRDDGSPHWLPVFEEGRHVRFSITPEDLDTPGATWDPSRIVYLQNSSDPITLWKPQLIWSRPEWMDTPRGPDVSPTMFWMPVITFWQTAADMAFSTGVPAGHGHKYGANPVNAWAAIYPPDGWTEADNEALREIIGHD